MKPFSFSVSILACVALAGCAGAAESLGLGRNSPDAFAVVDRPPLALPPDYDLRPPQPGAARPQEINMAEAAQSALFGEQKTAVPSASSASEKALLAQAGTDKADPYIRTLLDWEASQKVVGEEHLIKTLLGDEDASSDAAVVDAQAESDRLRKAKEDGAPVNTGPTPIIEKEKNGWLGL